MKDSLPSDFSLRADLQGELRDLLRPILREELRQLVADPQALRALLFQSLAREQVVPAESPISPRLTALLPFVGGSCSGGGITATSNTAGRVPIWNTGCDLKDSNISQDGSGHVGIGITSLSYALEVMGSIWPHGGTLFVDNGYGPSWSGNGSYKFDFDSSGNILLNPTVGKVGVGTSSPSAKLHVKTGSVLSEFNYGTDGDLRNLVLNQLDSSLRRTSIGFKWDNSGSPQEQYFLGADLLGSSAQRNFFLYDSIQDRPLEIWISPRGGSNDDQLQIQAAIDLLAAKSPPGGIIHLAPGVFRIGDTIAIKGNGVKLRGAGGAVSPTLFTVTGTVSVSNGSATVTGSGTQFTTEVAVNDIVYVQVGATQQHAKVTSIASDTQLTVDTAFTSPVTGSGSNMQDSPAAPPAATRLLWTKGGSGTMIQMKSPLINGHLQDLELSDLNLHGNSLATIGLLLDRILNSKFINVTLWNPNSSGATGIKLTTTADGGNDHGNTHQGNDCNTAFNHFEECSIQDWDTGLHLTGVGYETTNGAVANCCHNTFLSLNIQGSSTGIKLESCDNNSFYRAVTGSTTNGVLIVSPVTAYSNYFYHLQAGGGLYITGTSAQGVTNYKTHIYGYDQGNGETDPATDSNPVTNFLFWINWKGQIQGNICISSTSSC